MDEIETCPRCGCEAEKVTRIFRHDRTTDEQIEIGYYDRCGARVVGALLTGNGWY